MGADPTAIPWLVRQRISGDSGRRPYCGAHDGRMTGCMTREISHWLVHRTDKVLQPRATRQRLARLQERGKEQTTDRYGSDRCRA